MHSLGFHFHSIAVHVTNVTIRMVFSRVIHPQSMNDVPQEEGSKPAPISCQCNDANDPSSSMQGLDVVINIGASALIFIVDQILRGS